MQSKTQSSTPTDEGKKQREAVYDAIDQNQGHIVKRIYRLEREAGLDRATALDLLADIDRLHSHLRSAVGLILDGIILDGIITP